MTFKVNFKTIDANTRRDISTAFNNHIGSQISKINNHHNFTLWLGKCVCVTGFTTAASFLAEKIIPHTKWAPSLSFVMPYLTPVAVGAGIATTALFLMLYRNLSTTPQYPTNSYIEVEVETTKEELTKEELKIEIENSTKELNGQIEILISEKEQLEKKLTESAKKDVEIKNSKQTINELARKIETLQTELDTRTASLREQEAIRIVYKDQKEKLETEIKEKKVAIKKLTEEHQDQQLKLVRQNRALQKQLNELKNLTPAENTSTTTQSANEIQQREGRSNTPPDQSFTGLPLFVDIEDPELTTTTGSLNTTTQQLSNKPIFGTPTKLKLGVKVNRK